MIEEFAELIPSSIQNVSGSVFYSGRAAFGAPSSIYILGLNPGGDPLSMREHTVAVHTERVLKHLPDEWSEYSDESWQRAIRGTWGLQPRIRHLLRNLGLDPRRIPASNLVFVRSAREATFEGDLAAHADEAWPFHQSVIETLEIRMIICLGKRAATVVRRKLNAHSLVDQFVEKNARRWRNEGHQNSEGILVLSLTHPSIADWTSLAADPTPMVQRLLGGLANH